MMLAIEFHKHFDVEKIHRRLVEAGFITGCKFNTIRFMPPLTISESDVYLVTKKTDNLLV